jgi:nitrite reductase/ring-hydroxylating ferredoxin subunit
MADFSLPLSSAPSSSIADDAGGWYRVADAGLPLDGARLHACVAGRYVTVFRQKGALTVIDSICHHAGGPLTLGKLQDIEELGGMVRRKS